MLQARSGDAFMRHWYSFGTGQAVRLGDVKVIRGALQGGDWHATNGSSVA